MKFASASLSFYNSERGYLMCNEHRSTYKGGPKNTLMYNTIGGKVDEGEYILDTAIREFIEETLLPVDAFDFLKEAIESKVYHFDYCCSESKQLFHRFYAMRVKTGDIPLIDDIVERFADRRTEDFGVSQLIWMETARIPDSNKSAFLIEKFFEMSQSDYDTFTKDMDILIHKYGRFYTHHMERYLKKKPIREEQLDGWEVAKPRRK